MLLIKSCKSVMKSSKSYNSIKFFKKTIVLKSPSGQEKFFGRDPLVGVHVHVNIYIPILKD